MTYKDIVLAREVVNQQISLADVQKMMRFNKPYYNAWYRLCYEPLAQLKKDSTQLKKTALSGLSLQQLQQLKKYQDQVFNELQHWNEVLKEWRKDPDFAAEVEDQGGILLSPDVLRYKDTVTSFSATDYNAETGAYNFNYTIEAYKKTIQSKIIACNLNDPNQVSLVNAQQELLNDLNTEINKLSQDPEGLLLINLIGGIL